MNVSKEGIQTMLKGLYRLTEVGLTWIGAISLFIIAMILREDHVKLFEYQKEIVALTRENAEKNRMLTDLMTLLLEDPEGNDRPDAPRPAYPNGGEAPIVPNGNKEREQ